ncbi:acyltransferase [Aeromonas cavernicola]|uniref:Acyltransferase n=1 Tax=Aeromonas cavernicola TaxID=1006623 RepID=A0A2H9U273_9GAMM|nr:acyltransferase [Aeromonas cavernicola]PJG58100.1 acyltransferase [Aeromonas cavernicola]
MTYTLTDRLRGSLSTLLYFCNTLFWFIPIILLGLLKLPLPVKRWRTGCNLLLDGCASCWIGFNNLIQKTIIRTAFEVVGVDKGRRNEWYMVIANHQSWVDILVLQRVFNQKIPFLKFFLKKELIWVPLLGLAWWALDFPFMRRYSKAFLATHPHMKGKDIATTQRACAKFRDTPVSVMNFVEGTRFTSAKHQQQGAPYRHLLQPRAGGIAFTLAAMGGQLQQLVDVTIAYPGGIPSYWDFMCGRVKAIKVQVRFMLIAPNLVGDYINDPVFQHTFQQWLNGIWQQKDQTMTQLLTDNIS